MRHLKLSDKDIDRIETALKYISSQGFKTVHNNKDVFGEEGVKAVLTNATKFEDLRDAISNGDKDV